MKTNKFWILPLMFLLVVSFVSADFFYEPMNFEPNSLTNHTFTAELNGSIEVQLPTNFTLISGSLTGSDTVNFVFQSPNITDEDVHIGIINVNGSFYSNFYLVSIADDKIVDTKIEIGHGDFNYVDHDSYISDENLLLFNLIRLWPIGSNILNEPATDITFTCTFPDIVPRTVDSKYSTTFNTNNVTASGELSRMEGISMFRVFVLSQDVNLDVNDTYDVNCSELSYYFENTRIVADISPISLEARTTEPLIVSGYNGSGFKTFSITNNESYEIRDVEFLWFYGSHTIREELDSLGPGETVVYDLPIDEDTVNFGSRFIPEWMFNSRAPTIYEQVYYNVSVEGVTYESIIYQEILDAISDLNGTITIGLADVAYFNNINASDYYNNTRIITPSILETQIWQTGIDTLQSPIEGDLFRLNYYVFNQDTGDLAKEVLTTINGVDSFNLVIDSDDLAPVSKVEQPYDVWVRVEMLNGNGMWQSFPLDYIGELNVVHLNDNGPRAGLYDVVVGTSYERLDVGESVSSDILIKNTGDLPDEDTVLTYWLEDSSGTRYSETREQFLEVPPGNTIITRSLALPVLSAPGEWKFRAEYETVVQPKIAVYDSFIVTEMTPFQKLQDRLPIFIKQNWLIFWGLVFLFILFILFLLILLVGGRDKKKNYKKEAYVDAHKRALTDKDAYVDAHKRNYTSRP